MALDCGTLVDGGGWLGGQWRARPGKKMKTNNMRLCGLELYEKRHGQVNCSIVICAKAGLIVGMKTNSAVKIDPEIMNGEPCFAGTGAPCGGLAKAST